MKEPVSDTITKINIEEVPITGHRFTLSTALPDGARWEDVRRRQTCSVDGTIIEDWTEVCNATADELRRPLAELGVPPQPLVIRYEVDPIAKRANHRVLTGLESLN